MKKGLAGGNKMRRTKAQKLFGPYLTEGETIEKSYRPKRRARAIGYAMTVLTGAVGAYFALQYGPEFESVVRDLAAGPPFTDQSAVLLEATISATGGLTAAGTLLGIIAKELSFATHRVALTSDRILKKTGLIRQDVESVSYERVQDASINQGLCARLTGTGDVRVSTAGSDGYEMILRDIEDPISASKLIKQKAKEAKLEAYLGD